ncbi:phosphoglycolate phosphatase [Spirochaetia bacterium]|nr:phosphoglycolate phosphatase [Spirochaetia bacterium]
MRIATRKLRGLLSAGDLCYNGTMKYKCVIFDLDGTLVDTIADIASAMNKALEARGFPAHAARDYTAMVGWGMRRLAFLALPPSSRDDAAADTLAREAGAIYNAEPLVHSKPYPGIPGLVAELKGHKIKTAVLTNKPHSITSLVISGLFPSGSFDAVCGDRPGSPRKPDPASAWEILADLDASPRDTVFMGDSEVDMETALAAECFALGVSWGFRDRSVLQKAGAKRIIDSPGELLEIIKGFKNNPS